MIAKDPIIPYLKRVAAVPCEILMSKNKWQFEIGIVINGKS